MLKNLVQVKVQLCIEIHRPSANTSAFTASCIVALNRDRNCAYIYIMHTRFLSDAQYSDYNLIRGYPLLKEFCKGNTESGFNSIMLAVSSPFLTSFFSAVSVSGSNKCLYSTRVQRDFFHIPPMNFSCGVKSEPELRVISPQLSVHDTEHLLNRI